MKGVQMKEFGGPEVLQYRTDLPVPVPRDGEVLVKNDFVGINYVDVYVYVTLLPFSPPPSRKHQMFLCSVQLTCEIPDIGASG